MWFGFSVQLLWTEYYLETNENEMILTASFLSFKKLKSWVKIDSDQIFVTLSVIMTDNEEV